MKPLNSQTSKTTKTTGSTLNNGAVAKSTWGKETISNKTKKDATIIPEQHTYDQPKRKDK